MVDAWYLYKGILKGKYVDDEVGFWVLIKIPSKSRVTVELKFDLNWIFVKYINFYGIIYQFLLEFFLNLPLI